MTIQEYLQRNKLITDGSFGTYYAGNIRQTRFQRLQTQSIQIASAISTTPILMLVPG